MAMTVKATMKAARGTGAGDTRMTVMTATTATMATTAAMAATAATMTPNGKGDNKDGNRKNNNKATTTPTSTTKGSERCQSCRDNHGGGHHHPRDAAIELTAASLRHAFIGSCCFLVESSILYYAWEYIENLDET